MNAVGFNNVITVKGGYQIWNIRSITNGFRNNKSISRNDSCRRSHKLSCAPTTNTVLCSSSQVEIKNSAREESE